MAVLGVPNWLRVALLLATTLSFLPQIHHLITRKTSTGISVRYTLLHLLSATEQFALALFYIVNAADSDFFVHNPVNAGDWINLAQTAVVVCCWIIVFGLCLHLPSDHRDMSRPSALCAFAAFLLISVVPVILHSFELASPSAGEWFSALFFGIHSLFLSWIVTCFGVLAMIFQKTEMRLRPASHALSRRGLAIQVGVFALIAVSWVARVRFPYEEVEPGMVSLGLLTSWYELVGWAAVDNAVFALGQAVLLGITSRRVGVESEVGDGETEPLLSG